jgi:hypothetical protein
VHVIGAYVVQLCIFIPFLSYIITHDRTCFKHERVSVFVLHKLLGLKRQRGVVKRVPWMRSKGGKCWRLDEEKDGEGG